MSKIKFYKRIGFKIIIAISILTIGGSAMGGSYIYDKVNRSVERKNENQIEGVMLLKQHQIDNWFKEKEEEVESLTRDARITASAEEATAHKAENEEDFDEHHLNLLEFLKNKKSEHGDFLELFLLSPDGEIHISTDKNQVKKIRTDEEYFIQGKEKTFIQNIFYDASSQEPTAIVASPIKKDGQTLAVLAGRLNLAKLSGILTEKAGLGETGETYLVNKFNYVVTDLKFSKNAIFKKAIYTPQVKRCLSDKSKEHFESTYNYQDQKVVANYHWLDKSELCLIAEIGWEEYFTAILQLRKAILLILILLIITISFLGILISNIITKPIHRLHKGTEIIEEGNLNYKVGTGAQDEIGQLSRSFDKMTESLRASQEELSQYSQGLEAKVRERTGELGKAKVTLEEKLKELERFSKLAIGRELKMIELKTKIKKLEAKINDNIENKNPGV